MAPLWETVRERLERRGTDNRGRIATPQLDATGRLTLKNLLNRSSTPGRIDLGELEAALVGLGVGTDLANAIAALGFRVSDEPAQRRNERARGATARAAARDAAGSWDEQWAGEWVDAVIKSGALRGMDGGAAIGLVNDVRRVLDEIARRATTDGTSLSRVDLSAQVLGDSHRLDTGRRLEAAVRRALALQTGPIDDEVRVWETAGVHPDLTSGPVLTWRLNMLGGLGPIVEAATAAGVPVHLSRMALIAHPVGVAPGAEVLVVENPRVVEAAAQRRTPRSVVSAGGSPSGAVQLLVRQLVDAGASVIYHGDFDTPGLALCARMASIGVKPWKMTANYYRSALEEADSQGVDLPLEQHQPPPTPWDPALSDMFDRERRIVHEERLLPNLLD